MADSETKLHTLELDMREIRSLHFAATLVASALKSAIEESGDEPTSLPDGRKVHACDSAVMKLEVVMLGEGAEL